jgi:hypothetical protein
MMAAVQRLTASRQLAGCETMSTESTADQKVKAASDGPKSRQEIRLIWVSFKTIG